MDNVRIEVDTKWVNQMFDELDFDNRRARNAVRAALRRAGRVILDEARQNLQDITTKQGKLQSKNLVEHVKMTVYKNAGGVQVDALAENRSSVKRKMAKAGKRDTSFVLRFLEGGTKPRMTRGHWNFRTWVSKTKIIRRGKPGYRGSLPASHFLKRAWDAKNQEAQRVGEEALINRINRIAKKKR